MSNLTRDSANPRDRLLLGSGTVASSLGHVDVTVEFSPRSRQFVVTTDARSIKLPVEHAIDEPPSSDITVAATEFTRESVLGPENREGFLQLARLERSRAESVLVSWRLHSVAVPRFKRLIDRLSEMQFRTDESINRINDVITELESVDDRDQLANRYVEHLYSAIFLERLATDSENTLLVGPDTFITSILDETSATTVESIDTAFMSDLSSEVLEFSSRPEAATTGQPSDLDIHGTVHEPGSPDGPLYRDSDVGRVKTPCCSDANVVSSTPLYQTPSAQFTSTGQTSHSSTLPAAINGPAGRHSRAIRNAGTVDVRVPSTQYQMPRQDKGANTSTGGSVSTTNRLEERKGLTRDSETAKNPALNRVYSVWHSAVARVQGFLCALPRLTMDVRRWIPELCRRTFDWVARILGGRPVVTALVITNGPDEVSYWVDRETVQVAHVQVDALKYSIWLRGPPQQKHPPPYLNRPGGRDSDDLPERLLLSIAPRSPSRPFRRDAAGMCDSHTHSV